ncbi:hypothetical protein B0H10DRAFT_1080017 [Mycena sp. CBHHK59/15]|nr:hypothetical protein B0H10DRAFT_1080017 [Mycena sp. CBHHK59/15]
MARLQYSGPSPPVKLPCGPPARHLLVHPPLPPRKERQGPRAAPPTAPPAGGTRTRAVRLRRRRPSLAPRPRRRRTRCRLQAVSGGQCEHDAQEGVREVRAGVRLRSSVPAVGRGSGRGRGKDGGRIEEVRRDPLDRVLAERDEGLHVRREPGGAWALGTSKVGVAVESHAANEGVADDANGKAPTTQPSSGSTSTASALHAEGGRPRRSCNTEDVAAGVSGVCSLGARE